MKLFKLLFILPMLSSLLMVAHFSRVYNNMLALGCLLFPLILLSKRTCDSPVPVFLQGGIVIWLERALFLVNLRQKLHMPWLRLPKWRHVVRIDILILVIAKRILKRRAGFTCALCGDRITRCNDKSIHYIFVGLRPKTARKVFLVLVIALHEVFQGVARIIIFQGG